jgi:hypothetical protein
MTTTDRLAEQAIARFNRQIRAAAHYIVEKFQPAVTPADAVAEATVMVLQYTGYMSGGPHQNSIAKIERYAEGDEKRVRKILLTQLFLDLEQKFGRELMKYKDETPVDLNPETLRAPGDNTYDPTDAIVSGIDFEKELPRLRKDYPHLIASAVDGLTEEEIAESLGISHQAVSKRITQEKARAANDPFFWLLGKDGKPERRSTRRQPDCQLAA